MNAKLISTPNAPTPNAPAAIGPYSQALDLGNVVYCSGQIPIVPATGELAEGLQAQAEQVFANIEAVLAAAGLTMANVVKTTVFLTDLADFAAVNEIYAKHFTTPYPARSCVQVAGLPKGAKLECEVVAVR